jgi:hypothetical protein
MKPKILFLLALLACLTGCMPVDSLNPFYTEKDVVFDESLLGKWIDVDPNGDRDILEFTAVEENGKNIGYKMAFFGAKDGAKCSALEFDATLVKIGERRFLDLKPKEWDFRAGSYPLRIVQSKTATSIQPALLKLSTGGYMEFVGGVQPQANLRIAHWLARLNFDGKKLRLDWADDAKFMQSVLDHKFKLANAILGEGKSKDIVITAGTKELQAFLLEHADDDSFFTEKGTESERMKE